MRKFLVLTLLVVIISLGLFTYWRFYHPFAEGNKSGLLVQFMLKGYVFKTYEGEMIQAGLRSYPNMPVATRDFRFSVAEEAVADSLMKCEGKELVLHYREYFGRLPWRGHTKYVVDKILFVKEPD